MLRSWVSQRGVGRLCLRLVPYAVRRWPGLVILLATLSAKTGLDLLTPWPMKLIVDNVFGQQPLPVALERLVAALPGGSFPEGLLIWSIAGMIVFFLLGWILGVVNAFARIEFGQRLVSDLAADLFGHLQSLSLRFHSRKSTGDSIRRITSDCGCASTIVKDALLPVAASVSSLVAMFLILWQLDSTLTLLALAAVPLMVTVLRRYARPMQERSYEQQEVEGRLYGIIERTLAAMPVVQAFCREEENDRAFRAATDATLAMKLASTRVQLAFKILMDGTTAAITAAILWVGAQHVLDGSLTVGSILVFLAYLRSFYGPLNALLYAPSTLNFVSGSARRVLEVLEAEPEVVDAPGAVPLGQTRGEVRLEGVTFGYEAGRPVLHGVDLEVQPGEVVALVGRTGAGKSTLVSLVPRLFDPWAGRVTVDGRDVRELQVRSLRERVAIVLQEPFLFPISVADNIAYGRPGAARAEVVAAAQAANAHVFIERLREGYDTVIGERGATLSGGERQRVSIARALLKDAPILILDEPTSALDAETEALLLEALERLMAGRTTLIIAHRLSTIRRADRIVVLEDGRVVESGPPAELLARGGLYARLHALQSPEPALAGPGVGWGPS